MQANFNHWRRHATDKGQIYLSNPQTGEVKWLWTRHHDRNTGRDYLVNAVSHERVWATPANSHLCPATSTRPQSAPTFTPSAANASRNATSSAPSVATAPRSATRYREVPAYRGGPQLGPDEVLLEDSTSGKRFISNKRTGSTRWVAAPTSASTAPRPHVRQNAQRPASAPGRKTANHTVVPQSAALLLQRAYRGFAVRRVGVIAKLRALDKTVYDIEVFCTKGTKYDLTELRRIANGGANNEEQRKDFADRLLQLGEVLTQAMLKVDAVESAGFAVIRNKRKRCVKKLIGLTENVEEMRSKLKR